MLLTSGLSQYGCGPCALECSAPYVYEAVLMTFGVPLGWAEELQATLAAGCWGCPWRQEKELWPHGLGAFPLAETQGQFAPPVVSRGHWAFLASDSTPALAVLVRNGKEKKQGGQGFS